MDLKKGISMLQIWREESDRNDGSIPFFILATERKSISL
jgi:hypothetical protein